MGKKMAVFDVDGVLLDNKLGGFKDVLIVLGKGEEVKKADNEYQERKYWGPWGLEEIAGLYAGFTRDRIKSVADEYCRENLQEGAKDCVRELRNNKDYLVGALSSNPQFIMDALAKELHLDFSEGTRLEFKNGIASGKIYKKVDRYGKAEILRERMEDWRVKKRNVVVVGDSITDLPMSELAGIFIGFRPKDDIIKQRAAKIVDSFRQIEKILCP